MASEIVVIVAVFLCFGLLFVCMLASFLRDQADLKKRMQRANERRTYNETLAENLRIELAAQQRAREIVAEQMRDNSPVSVPVTPQECQRRRRILPVEQK